MSSLRPKCTMSISLVPMGEQLTQKLFVNLKWLLLAMDWPLSWLKFDLPLLDQLNASIVTVKRKEENGGDLAYAEIATLTEDFASEALHPGDLKPSLGKALNSAMVDIRAGIKASGELKKAEKKLAAYIKSLQKKKK
ncbi:unnamed protein product [Symbiodinium sp. CCMP2592]|nr:unnamed protein product [Symbiodinium sp. CCMP2592]